MSSSRLRGSAAEGTNGARLRSLVSGLLREADPAAHLQAREGAPEDAVLVEVDLAAVLRAQEPVATAREEAHDLSRGRRGVGLHPLIAPANVVLELPAGLAGGPLRRRIEVRMSRRLRGIAPHHDLAAGNGQLDTDPVLRTALAVVLAQALQRDDTTGDPFAESLEPRHVIDDLCCERLRGIDTMPP